MIQIGNSTVRESWTEYGVEVDEDLLIECDTLAEAERYASTFQAEVLERHGYLTEWRPRQAARPGAVC